MKCECGKEITEEELKQSWNLKYKIKMCIECISSYCEEVITGN